MLGEDVETIEVEPWFALPQSLRSREIEWNRPHALGRYTAEMTVERGYEGLTDTQSLTFWVIPTVPAAIVLGALFVVFFVIRLFMVRFEIRRK